MTFAVGNAPGFFLEPQRALAFLLDAFAQTFSRLERVLALAKANSYVAVK